MGRAYIYKQGAVRWRRHDGKGDVRAYRAPKGWEVFAHLIDVHPITGKRLKRSEWWIQETYTGDVR